MCTVIGMLEFAQADNKTRAIACRSNHATSVRNSLCFQWSIYARTTPPDNPKVLPHRKQSPVDDENALICDGESHRMRTLGLTALPK